MMAGIYVFKSSRKMTELAIKMDIDGDENIIQTENALLRCHPQQGAWLQELWAVGVLSLNVAHITFSFHGN